MRSGNLSRNLPQNFSRIPTSFVVGETHHACTPNTIAEILGAHVSSDTCPTLDAVDLKILHALELDARRQNQDIAEAIGMSPSACLARVRRLEQNGVIRRYLTDIDLSSAMPWTELWAEITLLPIAENARLAFERRLSDIPEITRAHQLIGQADYALEIAGRDASVWPSILRKLDPDTTTIARSTVQIRVRVVKHFAGSPQLVQT
jgi:DNA-binding Lrp family transcriptional regulator